MSRSGSVWDFLSGHQGNIVTSSTTNAWPSIFRQLGASWSNDQGMNQSPADSPRGGRGPFSFSLSPSCFRVSVA